MQTGQHNPSNLDHQPRTAPLDSQDHPAVHSPVIAESGDLGRDIVAAQAAVTFAQAIYDRELPGRVCAIGTVPYGRYSGASQQLSDARAQLRRLIAKRTAAHAATFPTES